MIRSRLVLDLILHKELKRAANIRRSISSSSEEKIITIDRSGLFRPSNDHDKQAPQNAVNGVVKIPGNDLVRHIKSLIRFRGGPITLGEYMSEALTNPTAGYYTQRDVFGTAGDFITSPEISQMFGEMIGIWVVAQWQTSMGKPKKLNLVELGPGRGTLMADLIRGTRVFREFSAALSINLVEVSPVLRSIQMKNLGVSVMDETHSTHQMGDQIKAHTAAGIPVTWHRSMDSIEYSDGPVLYLAHEFFDALPVNQFQLTPRGWCERLVDENYGNDVSSDKTNGPHFRMVLSPGPTPSVRTLLQWRLQSMTVQERSKLKAIEISPQAVALAETLAEKIGRHGGAALIIDYGKDGPYADSLMAIKNHERCDVFDTPGFADLSAWVDFEAVRLAVNKSSQGATTYGPISQAQFLHGLGIIERLKKLLENASVEQSNALIAGYHRLVSDECNVDGNDSNESHESHENNTSGGTGMGQSYKVMCIVPSGQPPPIPFQ